LVLPNPFLSEILSSDNTSGGQTELNTQYPGAARMNFWLDAKSERDADFLIRVV
jgi:hypothetical protein